MCLTVWPWKEKNCIEVFDLVQMFEKVSNTYTIHDILQLGLTVLSQDKNI